MDFKDDKDADYSCLYYYELAMFLNLTMVLVVASLSFAKGMIMSQGINISSLVFYRFCVMYAFKWLREKVSSYFNKP